MTIPVVPVTSPVLPPYVPPIGPTPMITPFTYRDGVTYLQKSEDLIRYIQRVLIPWVHSSYSDNSDFLEEEINKMIDSVNEALAQQNEYVDQELAALKAYVDSIYDELVTDGVQLQDDVMAGIVATDDSATRTEMDKHYAAVDGVGAVYVEKPRLAKNSLTGWFHVDGFVDTADGVVDNSIDIQTAVNAAVGHRLYFPPGEYFITVPINVPAESSLHFAEGASVEFTSIEAFSVKGSNFKFVGGFFTSTLQTNSVIGLDNGIQDIDIIGCEVQDASLLTRNLGALTYPDFVESTWVNNITIANVTLRSTIVNPNKAAIYVAYADSVEVSNCYINGYQYGIVTYGGNADTSINGSVGNQRKCRNVNISNNIIKTTGVHGIWLSMVDGGNVTGNNLDVCGSAGIEFDGSRDISISSNTATKFQGGGIASNFLNTNFAIIGNTITSDTGYPVFYIRNDTIDAYNDNTNGQIIGNVARGLTNDTPSPFMIGSASDITIQGNTFVNVRLGMSTNAKSANICVRENSFTYRSLAIANFVAVSLRNPLMGMGHTIQNNRITSYVNQPVGSIAIQIFASDSEATQTNMIMGNTTYGFATDIEINSGGASTANRCRYYISRNTMQEVPVVTVKNSGFYSGETYYEDNRAKTMMNWPGTTGGIKGRFMKGQKIWGNDTDAGEKIGWVCVDTGWANQTVWAQSVAKVIGDVVVNGTSIYGCVQAGTTAPSGSGPTGTGSDIIDGTVHWRYTGTNTAFKLFGSIDA